MTTVLIVCGAGASSTFLASRMRAVARTRGVDVTVQAASDDEIDERLPSVDVILVGSHLSGSFDVIRARAAEHGVPAGLLDASVFGPTGADDAFDLLSTLAPHGLADSRTLTKETPHA
jgi:PTS system cellobiose-specific IIB component